MAARVPEEKLVEAPSESNIGEALVFLTPSWEGPDNLQRHRGKRWRASPPGQGLVRPRWEH
jgi:hypothetical protein